MSAVAQAQVFSLYSRQISETELVRTIGHIAWTAKQEEAALTQIGAAILRVPGLVGFCFEPSGEIPYLPIYEVMKPSSLTRASAIGAVVANEAKFGQVRVFFDPHVRPEVESPVRAAKFVGQQLGLLFHRLYLVRERERSAARLEALERGTRRRKIIHRAAGILSQQRDVSVRDALSLIVQYARRNRRTLVDISEALIYGWDSGTFVRPQLRRLASSEFTSSGRHRSLA